jgi:hypothetical protein
MTNAAGAVLLTFDLMCSWCDKPPVYRLYLDGQLMTERTYTWDNTTTHIKEHVPAMLAPGLHYLSIENLTPQTSAFTINNFEINRKPYHYRADTGKFSVDQSMLDKINTTEQDQNNEPKEFN